MVQSHSEAPAPPLAPQAASSIPASTEPPRDPQTTATMQQAFQVSHRAVARLAIDDQRSYPPVIPTRPHSRPTIPSPTSIPAFLRRLAFVLSLLVGASSLAAMFFSTFLLPLLHSSYAARHAIVEGQLPHFQTLVDRLRGLRANQLYPLPIMPPSNTPEVPTPEEQRVLFEEVPSSMASRSTSPAPPSLPVSPLSSEAVTTLRSALVDLSTAMDATATTRTSLLSTLEGYTSHLHRELYVPRDRDTNGPGEEWNAIRKEVRAMKGVLLNRRNLGVAMPS